MDGCPWCGEWYELTPESEPRHLIRCEAFQSRPIVAWVKGKPFVSVPGAEHILVEKWPLRGN